jgi:PAS domain S-box-containing protein/putative nucleotidyltransferase with HDIG domain
LTPPEQRSEGSPVSACEDALACAGPRAHVADSGASRPASTNGLQTACPLSGTGATCISCGVCAGVLNAVQALVVVLDREGRILSLNRACTEATGYSTDEARGRRFRDFLLSNERGAPVQDVLGGPSAADLPDRYEDVWVAKDGRRLLVSWSVSLVHAEDGSARFVIATGLEIAADRETGKPRLRSEAWYRPLVSGLRGIAFRDRFDETRMFVGGAVKEITGYDPAEFMDRSRRWDDLIHPADLEAAGRDGRGRHDAPDHRTEREYRIVRKDGGIRWVHATISGMSDGSCQPIGIQGVIIDVSERRSVESSLKETEGRYQTLVDTSPDSIVLTDLEGRILMANPQAASMHGFPTPGEMIGLSSFELIAPEDRERALENAARVLETARSGLVQYAVLGHDGTRIPVELSASLVVTATGEPDGFMAVTRDISERKRAEATQSVLLHVSQAVHQTEGLAELLALVRSELARLMDTADFHVALYDEQDGSYTCPYRHDERADPDDVTPLSLSRSLIDYVRRTGEPLMAGRQEQEALVTTGEVALAAAPPSVWLGVPIRGAHGTIGVIAVLSDASEPQYSRRDLELMSLVSDSIATAIERSLEDERRRRRLEFDQTAADIATSLVTAAPNGTDRAIEHGLARVGELLDVDRCFILLLTQDGVSMDEAFEWNAPNVAPTIDSFRRVPLAAFPWGVGTLLDSRSLVIDGVEDLPPEAAPTRRFLESIGAKSFLAVPMRARTDIIGAVGAVVLGRPAKWPAETTALFQALGAMFAAAIERKRADDALVSSLERHERAVRGTATALSRLGELRDPYTAGHQQRVALLAREIAFDMGLSDEMAQSVHIAAMLHDIGKIRVPSEILTKPGSLDDLERGIVETHSRAGYEILKSAQFPWPVAEVVLQHHERLDGSGYPAGLPADQIMIEARILGVADVVEAMSSHRPYRPALPIERAIEEITSNCGLLYDREVVQACLRVLERWGRRFPET